MTASPGIIVLDRAGRVGFSTEAAAALLRLGDGLTVRGARLVRRQGGPRLEARSRPPWRRRRTHPPARCGPSCCAAGSGRR